MKAVRVLSLFAFTLSVALGTVSLEAAAPGARAGNACSENPSTGGIGGTGHSDEPGGIGGTGHGEESDVAGTGQRAEGGIGGTGIAPEDEAAKHVAGRILFVHGTVEALLDGSSRVLSKGDWVCEGDTLISGEGARAQISMNDGGKLIVRPETKLAIERFSFKGAIDGTERLAIFLAKGSFRSITGMIGKIHKENYTIHTPNATIGIRGTDHETGFIPILQREKQSAEPGTYNRVISGGTVLRSERGVLELNSGQIGFAPFEGAPRLLPSVPQFFQQQMLNLSPSSKNTDDSAQNDIVQPTTIVNGVINIGSDLGPLSIAPDGTASVGAQLGKGSISSGGLITDGEGLIVLIDDNGLPKVITNNTTNFNYVGNAVALIDFGSAVVDDVSVIWGIYAGGITFDAAGNPSPINFHHFALAAGAATPDQVITNISGTAAFSNIVGFTKPTNELGGIGGNVTLNAGLQLGANPAVTTYSIGVVDANSRTWSGNFSGSASLSRFAQSGIPLSVTCVGAQCGAGTGIGTATGILIGPNAKGLITSYGLATTSGQMVGGVVVLSRP